MNKLLSLTAASQSAVSNVSNNSSTFDFTAVFIILSILVSIAVPVVIFLLGKVKFKGAVKMMFLGIAGFIVFYVLIPSLISCIVLPGFSSQNASYVDSLIYLAIRIICLEAGRFLTFFLFRKKNNSWGDALMLCAGYCIVDAFVIVVGILFPYLITVLSSDVSQVDGTRRELLLFIKKENINSAKAWRFLTYGIVNLAFSSAQLLSSALMYVAVNKKEKWPVIFTLLADVLIFIPNKLSGYKVWFFSNDYVTIPYLLIMAVVLYLMTYIVYKKVCLRKEANVDTSYLDKLAGNKEKNEGK